MCVRIFVCVFHFFQHNSLQTLENDIYFSNGHNCYAISEDPQFTTPFHVEYEENQVWSDLQVCHLRWYCIPVRLARFTTYSNVVGFFCRIETWSDFDGTTEHRKQNHRAVPIWWSQVTLAPHGQLSCLHWCPILKILYKRLHVVGLLNGSSFNQRKLLVRVHFVLQQRCQTDCQYNSVTFSTG